MNTDETSLKGDKLQYFGRVVTSKLLLPTWSTNYYIASTSEGVSTTVATTSCMNTTPTPVFHANMKKQQIFFDRKK